MVNGEWGVSSEESVVSKDMIINRLGFLIAGTDTIPTLAVILRWNSKLTTE